MGMQRVIGRAGVGVDNIDAVSKEFAVPIDENGLADANATSRILTATGCGW